MGAKRYEYITVPYMGPLWRDLTEAGFITQEVTGSISLPATQRDAHMIRRLDHPKCTFATRMQGNKVNIMTGKPTK